jgi:ribosomal protein S18 acetylase RimI-like enzyme
MAQIAEQAPVGCRAVEEHQRELAERWTRVQKGVVRSDDDMLMFVVGEPIPWTNGVHLARLRPDNADGRIEAAIALFRGHGVPAMWWVGPSSLPSDLGERLLRHGLRPGSPLPWLGMEIEALGPGTLPPGVEAHPVDSAELQESWLEAMRAGFGMDSAVQAAMTRLADAVGWTDDAPWQRFVALEGGRPVGSSGLMLGSDLAGIYNVATVPESRGRGIGSAMTAMAMRRARELGYSVAVLGAEGEAIRVYERLGFRRICIIRSFILDVRTGEGISSR